MTYEEEKRIFQDQGFIDVTGLDAAEILMAFCNMSAPAGSSWRAGDFSYKPMTKRDARKILRNCVRNKSRYRGVDYWHGRRAKVSFHLADLPDGNGVFHNWLDAWSFDERYGEGCSAAILNLIRTKKRGLARILQCAR